MHIVGLDFWGSMTVHLTRAEPHESEAIATMVGELLREIMALVRDKSFVFEYAETVGRARTWMKEGRYTVVLARVDATPVGFLALSESYALYTGGVYGTIPEFYVRPMYRSQGIGAALLAEATQIGWQRGWIRLEVTTPPLPQFHRTLSFYQRNQFTISGGRKLKRELS